MRIFEYRKYFYESEINSHVTPQNKICKIKGITKKSPETTNCRFIVHALALYGLSTKSNVILFMEQPPYNWLTSILRCKGIVGFHKSLSLYELVRHVRMFSSYLKMFLFFFLIRRYLIRPLIDVKRFENIPRVCLLQSL